MESYEYDGSTLSRNPRTLFELLWAEHQLEA